jgi:hypothetical protein
VKRRKQARSATYRRSSTRPPDGYHDPRVRRHLQRLLHELAVPLLGAGVTPRHFADIAASAFVKAACKASTLRNGRVNQSRVAVLTGLTRAEVRRVLSGSTVASSRKQPRTMRVLEGWQSDRRYQDKKGRPLSLRLSGARMSFESLVKKYAGDVPHHAVLAELRRLKVIREPNQHVELRGSGAYSSAALLKALSSLLPLISDSFNSPSVSTPQVPLTIRHLTLKALDTRDLLVMHERAVTGATAFLNGLDRSLGSPTTPRRLSEQTKHQVRISVLVRQR